METIRALELVVGFPRFAKAVPGAAGTLRIESDTRVFGIALDTGASIEPKPAAAEAELLHQRTTQLGFDTWRIDGIDRQFVARPGGLRTGTDDVVIAYGSTAIQVLDRASERRRWIAVPPPIDLGDPITGGTQGDMDRLPVYVEPGFVVFARSPALLVVARSDVERAMVFDEVTWSIETILAVREPELAMPARRGRWRGVVTDSGSFDVWPSGEPIQVRDRWWPPAGWASLEVAGSEPIALRAPLPAHRIVRASVFDAPLFRAPPRLVTWPGMEFLEPGSPPAGFEALATTRTPAPEVADALRWAREIDLEHRLGAQGEITPVLSWLHALVGDDPDAHGDAYHWLTTELWFEWTVTPAAAFAVPALVAIASVPATPTRASIAEALGMIATTAMGSDVPAARAVIYALRRMMPVLARLTEASPGLVVAWSRIVCAVALDEPVRPSWLARMAATCDEFHAVYNADELRTEIDELY